MAVELLLSNTTALLVGFAVFSVLYVIWQHINDPLRDVPGPFLARFTRLWELNAISKGNFQETHFKLHQRYGPVVRLAPNKYSVSDPEQASHIYHHGSKFPKSSFYYPFGNPNPEDADIFSEQSNERHALKRRKVSSLYSMSTLISYEKFVDRCNARLTENMIGFAESGAAFEVRKWMQYYAFDVIGEISVGQPFGFLEKGHDFNGVLEAVQTTMTYGSRIGLLPELHSIFSSIAKITKQPIPFDKVLSFIDNNINARKKGCLPTDRNDFLSKLLTLRKEDRIDDNDVQTSLGANIAAGSDTTAISLSTIVYHLAKSPEAVRKLRREIRDCEANGALSDPITFHEAQKMPYLQAIIKEALRIHPAIGLMLSRTVPPGGVTICGRHFPEGTEIGSSPWLTNFDEHIFGPDTRRFIPERWLEDPAKTSKMDQYNLTFGAGARTCLGKNISMLEMTKVIPQLFRRFEFELERPDEDWELDLKWFVKQTFRCRVKLLEQ